MTRGMTNREADFGQGKVVLDLAEKVKFASERIDAIRERMQDGSEARERAQAREERLACHKVDPKKLDATGDVVLLCGASLRRSAPRRDAREAWAARDFTEACLFLKGTRAGDGEPSPQPPRGLPQLPHLGWSSIARSLTLFFRPQPPQR